MEKTPQTAALYGDWGPNYYKADNIDQVIKAEPLLRAEEEVELAQKIEAGLYASHLLINGGAEKYNPDELGEIALEGQQAKERFIRANQRLVAKIASRFTGTNQGQNFLDSMQDGQAGLIKAIEGFDFTQGTKFSTYGFRIIKQSVVRGKNRAIYVPANLRSGLHEINAIAAEFFDDHGYKPSAEEIASRHSLDAQTIQQLLDSENVASIDFQIDSESGAELGDFIVGDDNAFESRIADAILLEDLLSVLSTLEQNILKNRYGLADNEPKSRQQIAVMFNMTLAQVRKKENDALNKMRNSSVIEPLT